MQKFYPLLVFCMLFSSLSTYSQHDASSPYLALALAESVPLGRYDASIFDIDRDGHPELLYRTEESGFGILSRTAFDIDFVNEVQVRLSETAGLLGFVKLDAEPGGATHLVFRDQDTLSFVALSLGGGIFNDSGFRIEAADEITLKTGKRRSGGEWAILGFPDSTVFVGLPRTSGLAGTTSNKSFNSTGYNLVTKFSSMQGEKLAFNPDYFQTEGLSDLDGDGVDDILRLRRNGDGPPVGITVLDGDTFGEIWRWDFPEGQTENILKGFHGFADADGDGMKELFCGDNLVVFSDGSIQEIGNNFRILQLLDVDNDGLNDIVGADRTAGKIVAFGTQTVTALDSVSLPSRVSFEPPYPNPFSVSNTLSFSLERASEVRLTIYDILGRKVRELIDKPLAPGSYKIVWEGRNEAGLQLPSGAYFAVLQNKDVSVSRSIFISR